MNRLTRDCLLSIAILAAFVSGGSSAAVPATLSYQGILTDGAGQPVTGSKSITLRLYNVAAGGTAFWEEQQTVALVDGRLSVVLGGNKDKPLNPKRFTGETYIGIQVGADTELPRQKFSSVAYAFQAGDGGVPKGGIIMWSGAVADIPAGWALCDGQHGTPDLRNNFVIGAGSTYEPRKPGGTATNDISHLHGIADDTRDTNPAGDHTHTFGGTTGWPNEGDHTVNSDGGQHVADDAHSHNFSGTTSGPSTWHAHSINAHGHGGATGGAILPGGTTTIDNLPPFIALAYIMKL